MSLSIKRSLLLKILPWLSCLLFDKGTLAQSLNATTVKGPPWRILFFGSDDFSLRTLIALTDEFKASKKLISKLELMFIDDESKVWKHAYEHRIKRIPWPPEFAIELRDKYDIGIVVSFGELICKDFIREFPLGIVNAHPSLLPRWRGVSPIPHAIMYGDTETGVTITKVKPDDEDITGDIVKQTRITIGPHEYTPQLDERLANASANLVLSLIKDLRKSVQKPIPQATENVTYAPLLKQKMSWIVWKQWTAGYIYNRHRGLSHIWPVATIWKSFVVKFHNFSVVPAAEAVSLDILAAATKPPTSTPKAEKLHNLQASPHRELDEIPHQQAMPEKLLNHQASLRGHRGPQKTPRLYFNLLAKSSDLQASHRHLHILQAKMGQQGGGFRRKPKPVVTRKPRGRQTTTPADGDEEGPGALMDEEAANLPNVSDTHETPKQARARWVKEIYQPPTTLDPDNLPPETWLRPGLVMFDKSVQALRVMCVDGAQLLVPSVSVSKRKTMDASSFHNGFLSRTKPYNRVFSEYSHFIGKDATKPPWTNVSPKRRKG